MKLALLLAAAAVAGVAWRMLADEVCEQPPGGWARSHATTPPVDL